MRKHIPHAGWLTVFFFASLTAGSAKAEICPTKDFPTSLGYESQVQARMNCLAKHIADLDDKLSEARNLLSYNRKVCGIMTNNSWSIVYVPAEWRGEDCQKFAQMLGATKINLMCLWNYTKPAPASISKERDINDSSPFGAVERGIWIPGNSPDTCGW